MSAALERAIRMAENPGAYQVTVRIPAMGRVRLVILDCSWAVHAAADAIRSGTWSDDALRLVLAARRGRHGALAWDAPAGGMTHTAAWQDEPARWPAA